MKPNSAIHLATSRLLYPAVLIVAILGCYYGLWNAYFSSDDFWMLGWVRHQPSLSAAIWAEFGYSIRILLDGLLWMRVRVFDLNPSPYYWVSLFQHIVVTLGVYWLVRNWTGRSAVALIAGLFFGTTSTHFEVITWITGSNYSLAAIPYLAALAFFGLYLRRGNRLSYVGALAASVAGLLLTELAISLPLVLLAYRFTMGRDHGARVMSWRQIRPVVPFYLLLGVYLLTQVLMIHAGSSEATTAEQVYKPGLHMIGNLTYLLYLALPPYGPAYLMGRLGTAPVEAAMLAIAIVGHIVAVLVVWRGSPVARFAVAFTYLSFLPYSLWQGDFAAAIRYRYLPAIGFSLLIALLLVWLYDRLLERRGIGYRLIVPGLVTLLVVINVVLVQVWVQRHIANSAFRRLAVTQLVANYSNARPGTRLMIQVPAEKFGDIGQACRLVFEQRIHCEAFAGGILPDRELKPQIGGEPTYWLQASDEGLRQIYPLVSKVPDAR
jgi:hypothetical protein